MTLETWWIYLITDVEAAVSSKKGKPQIMKEDIKGFILQKRM